MNIEIDPGTIDAMRSLQQKTGVGVSKLLSSRRDVPAGLTASKIEGWRSGKTRRAKREDVEYVLSVWNSLPQYEFVEVTEDVSLMLRAYRDQSGVGPYALLRGRRADRPKGLKSPMVQRWLEGQAGGVRKDHLDFVLARWRAVINGSRDRVPITGDYLAQLQLHRTRSGVGPTKLLTLGGVPDSLSVAMLRNWINGKIGTARRDHLEFVLERWAALPTADISLSGLGIEPHKVRCRQVVVTDESRPWSGHGVDVRLPLTQEIIAELVALQEKSGLGPAPLFKWAAKHGIPIPRGVSAQALGACMRSGPKTVSSQLLAFAIETWRAVCVHGERLVPIEGWMMTSLLRSRDVGFLPERLFDGAADVPNGLDAGVIGEWLDGSAAEAKKNHLDWVLDRCKALSISEMPRVMITEDVRAALIAHRERTGVGASALLKGARDIPTGLSASLVTAWIGGYIDSARKDYLDYVIARWKALPDARGGGSAT